MGTLELKFKEKWIGYCSTCKQDDAVISLVSDPYCLECFNQPLDVWDEWKKPKPDNKLTNWLKNKDKKEEKQ